MREIRNDHRSMADHGDHRIALIDVALPGITARVSVHIGEYFDFLLAAQRPEGGAAGCVECDGSILIDVWIQVVVADLPRARALPGALRTQQKCPTFTMPTPAGAEVENDPPPQQYGDPDTYHGRFRRQCSHPHLAVSETPPRNR
jgi:hypothetical protein